MDLSDEQLMRAYRKGDLSAFDALYARYRGPLYRYVGGLCNHAEHTDELFQDVWLRVVSARDQWDEKRPFAPWLYRIAHHRVIDHWRAHGQQLQADIDPDDMPGLSPAQEMIAHLRNCVKRLRLLLGSLPELQRSAFLLKEESGLTLAQIAQVTGSERETVKSRLRYALRRLRAGLEGCDEG